VLLVVPTRTASVDQIVERGRCLGSRLAQDGGEVCGRQFSRRPEHGVCYLPAGGGRPWKAAGAFGVAAGYEVEDGCSPTLWLLCLAGPGDDELALERLQGPLHSPGVTQPEPPAERRAGLRAVLEQRLGEIQLERRERVRVLEVVLVAGTAGQG